MIIPETAVTLKDGTKVILRSPQRRDAAQLNEYLRLTSGETHYMVRYPEECDRTLEAAQKRLWAVTDHERSFMLAAFLDGELVGNCGINAMSDHFKMRHRASLGISIKKKAWGLGLGRRRKTALRRWSWGCLPTMTAPGICTGSSALPRWAAFRRRSVSRTAHTATRCRW